MDNTKDFYGIIHAKAYLLIADALKSFLSMNISNVISTFAKPFENPLNLSLDADSKNQEMKDGKRNIIVNSEEVSQLLFNRFGIVVDTCALLSMATKMLCLISAFSSIIKLKKYDIETSPSIKLLTISRTIAYSMFANKITSIIIANLATITIKLTGIEKIINALPESKKFSKSLANIDFPNIANLVKGYSLYMSQTLYDAVAGYVVSAIQDRSIIKSMITNAKEDPEQLFKTICNFTTQYIFVAMLKVYAYTIIEKAITNKINKMLENKKTQSRDETESKYKTAKLKIIGKILLFAISVILISLVFRDISFIGTGVINNAIAKTNDPHLSAILNKLAIVPTISAYLSGTTIMVSINVFISMATGAFLKKAGELLSDNTYHVDKDMPNLSRFCKQELGLFLNFGSFYAPKLLSYLPQSIKDYLEAKNINDTDTLLYKNFNKIRNIASSLPTTISLFGTATASPYILPITSVAICVSLYFIYDSIMQKKETNTELVNAELNAEEVSAKVNKVIDGEDNRAMNESGKREL